METTAANAAAAAIPTSASFDYEAQTPNGYTLSGAISAGSIDQAAYQLRSLQLHVTRLEAAKKPPSPKSIRTEDFLAFNQQLAQLTTAGIPLERGLRLIASDIRGRRGRHAVSAIAAELEKGTPLEQAFAAHKGHFPPLYGKLLEAGVRAGNLPGMLLSVGRHAEMVQRLRAAIWRAASYPLMVLISLLLIMVYIWGWIMPRLTFAQMSPDSFDTMMGDGPATAALDPRSVIAMDISFGLMALIALVLAVFAILWLIARTQRGSQAVQRLLFPVPLLGPILRWNLLARWCDALQMGVSAGLDLPQALELAGDAVDSTRLRADGSRLAAALLAGRPMDAETNFAFLPIIVPASLQMGSEQNDLPRTVATLAKMYQEQAEVRLNVLPAALSPILLLLVATCVGAALLSVILPLSDLLRVIEGLS